MLINNNFLKKRAQEKEQGIKKHLTNVENRYVQPFNITQSINVFI